MSNPLNQGRDIDNLGNNLNAYQQNCLVIDVELGSRDVLCSVEDNMLEHYKHYN